MRGRRPRNTELEKYVAKNQARYLGMDPQDVFGLIDRKGGDYYQSDLYPDQAVMKQAEDDFNTFRTGTPAMNQIADDMRSYYGIGGSPPQNVMTNLPPEIAAQVTAVSEPYVKQQPAAVQKPQPMRNPAPAPSVTPKDVETGLLRRAGEAIRSLDNAYAAKVSEGAHPFVKMTSGFPITYAPAGTAAEKAAAYGMLGVNAAARYALPAGGVTLAGKGLYDLTHMLLDQQSSGTIDPQ